MIEGRVQIMHRQVTLNMLTNFSFKNNMIYDICFSTNFFLLFKKDVNKYFYLNSSQSLHFRLANYLWTRITDFIFIPIINIWCINVCLKYWSKIKYHTRCNDEKKTVLLRSPFIVIYFLVFLGNVLLFLRFIIFA